MIHIPDAQECPSCSEKLLTADPLLQSWFKVVKSNFSNAHISWAWRDQKDQEQAFIEGKSRQTWPESEHNHMVNNQPSSLAIDLFVLSNGVALFPVSFYKEIDAMNQLNHPQIQWGGNYPHFKDFDHFFLSAPPLSSLAA